jgi:hypothetical protein
MTKKKRAWNHRALEQGVRSPYNVFSLYLIETPEIHDTFIILTRIDSKSLDNVTTMYLITTLGMRQQISIT